MTSKIEALLDRNPAFAASGDWRNTPSQPFLPNGGLYVVTCIDPRTEPAEFLGLGFAEASSSARSAGGWPPT